ncbi:hypothetical protein N8843_07785 [Verrucomicrobia bacterium]|nr:hypothetical protein [Verrucomicrobiota bacterium]
MSNLLLKRSEPRAENRIYLTKETLTQECVDEFDEIVDPDFDRLFNLDKPHLEEYDHVDEVISDLQKTFVEMINVKEEVDKFMELIEETEAKYLQLEKEFNDAKEEANLKIEEWVNSDIEEEVVFENDWFEVEGEDIKLTDAGFSLINNLQYQLVYKADAFGFGWGDPKDLELEDELDAIGEVKDYLNGRTSQALDRFESMNSQIEKFSEFIGQLTS